MNESSPNTSVRFSCGATMKNRFMLAPLTNKQSHEDGKLSEDEFNWLTLRSKGQFGLVMTCASHVQEIGKGFERQLGIFDDKHIAGHQRLSASIQENGALAIIQLHHAGMRSPKEIIGEQPVCPSRNEKLDARALTIEEVTQLKDDFISAAIRAKKSGYDGVEVHGAHGYILTQFLSSEINHRTDKYGGSLENRARIIFEIVHGIRKACGNGFVLGVRLSPERFGMELSEVKIVSQRLIDECDIDFLDISLWDSFKFPEDESYGNVSLLEHFQQLKFGTVKWTVAGKIRNATDVQRILDAGVDFVSIGRSGILHHNFPKLVMEDDQFQPIETPVAAAYLKEEGLGNDFIEYLSNWPGFVQETTV